MIVSTVNLRRDVDVHDATMYTLNKLTSSTVDITRAVNVFDNALIVNINKKGLMCLITNGLFQFII